MGLAGAQSSIQTGAPAVQNKELAGLLRDYREDELKHSPELASSLGDRRYNDQLSDLSPREANAKLERGRNFLVRLAGIDPATLNPQDKAAADKLQQALIAEQSAGARKSWQMPIDPETGVQVRLAELPSHIPLETAKDYDDYIARLKKIPDELRQAVTNLQLSSDEGHGIEATLVEKVLAQVNAVAAQKPEASVFAAPLKRFPASFPPAQKSRISEETLAAIQDDVLPAYARLGRFLSAQLAPAK
ncbi:DUF885 family protein [Granulicella rosea]|nr:DUF885 family protein [Granulicella rosea]